MTNDIPNILSHVSLGTNRFEQAAVFYDAVLETIGCRRVLDFPGGIGYGKVFPEFWIQHPIDGKPASCGNGTHVSFIAASTSEVDAFHAAALAHGGTDDGAPGPRPEYSPTYYACFVRDPDGHKIEAMWMDLSELAERYT